MNIIFKKESYIYFLIIFMFFVGLFTFRDYGIGIEEHFQRKSGFYWLNYVLNFFDFNEIKLISLEKYQRIEEFTPNLFPIEKVSFYGILFDLPAAFIEVILKIENPNYFFQIRHFLNFSIFLVSAYYFYKLILLRYNNINLAIIGFLIFIITPRIYGNIYFDNKDVFFLSVFTITFYLFLKFFLQSDLKNLIIFSLFCAFTTSTRIIGILVPISFLFIIFLSLFTKDNHKKNFNFLYFFVFFYFLFLFMHWPYLWTLKITEIQNFFVPFFYAMNPTVYFNGEFYQSKFLPLSYIPLWIFISTPIYLLLFFLSGFIYQIRRTFNRIINIEENSNIFKFDFWKTKKEKFDFIILFNFLLIISLYFSINLALLSGWRHFYFLNFFIVYYACFCIYIVYQLVKSQIHKSIFSILLIFFLSLNVYDLINYHPYQSVFFNKFISDEKKLEFEIDTQSLSRVDALKEILKENKKKVSVGTASWTPLEDGRSLIPPNKWESLHFVGTNLEEADFIYTNYYYELNTDYTDKYEIPENFSLYKNLIIDGTRIYSIYKKNNL